MLQLVDDGLAAFLAHDQAGFDAEAVDLPLDIEQRVDAFDGLQGNRRDRCRVLSPTLIGGDVGKLEELAPGVTPTKRRCDRSWTSAWVVKMSVAAIGIGLQDAGPGGEVLLRMLAPTVP